MVLNNDHKSVIAEHDDVTVKLRSPEWDGQPGNIKPPAIGIIILTM